MLYYKCKQCYSFVPEDNIRCHHTEVHVHVPYEYYIDKYFDRRRELHKCKFCSSKLTLKQLNKHLQRAHINKSLPREVRSAHSSMFEPISSDSEDEDTRKTKEINKSIQNELTKNDMECGSKSTDSRLEEMTIEVSSDSEETEVSKSTMVVENGAEQLANDDNEQPTQHDKVKQAAKDVDISNTEHSALKLNTAVHKYVDKNEKHLNKEVLATLFETISSNSEMEKTEVTKTSVDVAIQCELIPNDTERASKEPDSSIQAPTIDPISVESTIETIGVDSIQPTIETIGIECLSKDSSMDPDIEVTPLAIHEVNQSQHGAVKPVIETNEIAIQTSSPASANYCDHCKLKEMTKTTRTNDRMESKRATAQMSMESNEKRMKLSVEVDDGELLLVLS
ncbi:uncharacterized protein LOC116349743 [Contarinia nasturtii]|uniref:uncharacterized protein LOC116349743 n=1 Tax=Contarinia nasturtii TaxID=265458 RepID=UPI0012D3FE85|nr:uncharacterized protein LOC116349743 [Contarinia nasturtii]XP_031637179.1 uncharacterized protein LOC116349743 [Contarinia nasturtii]